MTSAERANRIDAEIDSQQRMLMKDQMKFLLHSITSLAEQLPEGDFEEVLTEVLGPEPELYRRGSRFQRFKDGRKKDQVALSPEQRKKE